MARRSIESSSSFSFSIIYKYGWFGLDSPFRLSLGCNLRYTLQFFFGDSRLGYISRWGSLVYGFGCIVFAQMRFIIETYTESAVIAM